MPAILDKISQALNPKKKEKKETKEESAQPSATAVKVADPTETKLHETKPAAEIHPDEAHPDTQEAAKDVPESPVFDNNKVTVIFVLGGPGAGKGTQCAKLVDEFGFCHLSAGDLLRAEQNREGSEFGQLIKDCIKEGTIVPMEVTVKLLQNAMSDALKESREGEGWQDGKGRFLIDGFPRKMDQALKFDESVCECACVLFFDTTEEVMLERLLERGKTSGREDDNAESIKKRFKTYHETTMPVIDHYKAMGKVAIVDSGVAVDEVYKGAADVARKVFTGGFKPNTTA
ncbi:adenylate kinase-domain-containing protein [Schizophyllum amplum]|uniref:Uridylate kinase n=1 Tax=Schizophyllum amplum TaxID=97359 RepID=A0A550BVP5_9AGAR|nr:adenylate kinase-domain-containing protein [Auriculariopsis ampla]